MPNPTVFISYAGEDEAWKDELRKFLKPLNVWNETNVWADDCIDDGANWFEAIKGAINDSAVAILMVSADFLGSEFIAKEEVPDLLRLRQERGMWVIPVLVHACPWKSIRWLKQMEMVPDRAEPLDRFEETARDDFLSDLANRIADLLQTWEEPAELAVLEAPVTAAIDISHLPETSAALFGRDGELDALDADWESPDTRVVAFVASGGVGKSALINRWLRDLEGADWRGAERVFGWSFYSQGARDQAATAEMFIDSALRFFGDPDPTRGSAWDRGERLAGLVAAQRTLLVLDGMEPLQSPHDFERGRLRDPGLQALLRRLTRESRGLCVISTREPVPELDGRAGSRAVDLSTITPEDGRALLRSLRVVGTDPELEALAGKFGPQALCVTLLGTWLYEQPGHRGDASGDLPPGPEPLGRVLAGFETLLRESPALDLLRVQGLFDRPAPFAQVLAAVDMDDLAAEAIERLRDLRLLAPHSRHSPKVLEAHPLIREHYAEQLRARFPDRFREGHRRVYDHLATTEHQPDTLAGLQPLYEAVRHGCLAGIPTHAVDLYRDRILRGTGSGGYYSTKKLGAIGADLGAVACFFVEPWSRLWPEIPESDQAWLLAVAAFNLRALGRLTEAAEPMRVTLEISIEAKQWENAASVAGNLSELELTLGEVSAAVADAGQSVTFADRLDDKFGHMVARTNHADALHQAGRRDEARRLFAEAEALQAESQPSYPRLYSVQGFQYCDLLLSAAERAAWLLECGGLTPLSVSMPSDGAPGRERVSSGSDAPEGQSDVTATALQSCREVAERARQALTIAKLSSLSLLTHALDHLTLGRAALYEAILTGSPIDNPTDPVPFATSAIDNAVEGLRRAGAMNHLPKGLLTRAWHRHLTGDASAAAADLDEAWEIAERGPMPLYQADVLLTRARLFGLNIEHGRLNTGEASLADAECGYPWGSVEGDLAEARRLIEKHGYHRRDEELADADAALRALREGPRANSGSPSRS